MGRTPYTLAEWMTYEEMESQRKYKHRWEGVASSAPRQGDLHPEPPLLPSAVLFDGFSNTVPALPPPWTGGSVFS